MSVHELGDRPILYANSPVRSREELLDTFACWSAGQTIQSEVAVVGALPLAPGQAVLQHPEFLSRPYSVVMPRTPLMEATAPLREALYGIIAADMERAGLQGAVKMRTHAGMYDHTHAEPFHVDKFSRQRLRWTVAYGMSGTVGALGGVSKHDLIDADTNANLWPEALERLAYVYPQEGQIARFSTIDVHAGCEAKTSTPRILTVGTVRLQ